MCPRKERYQTPEYVAQGIRDRRKKLLHGSYYCPKCGKDKLMIQIDKKEKRVIAVCSCGIEDSINYVSAYEAVDYYSKFIDKFNAK